MTPIVGITANISPAGDSRRTISSDAELEYIHRAYLEFVIAGGGFPVVLGPGSAPGAIREAMARIDGVIVSGGADVTPALYGQPVTKSERCDAGRDRFEIEVIRAARSLGRPILGICRGLQILNVAFGGTLHQHLYDAIPTDIVHHRDETGRERFHEVTRTRPSVALSADVFSEVFGNDTIGVNSTHHQAIDRPGEGLEVIAKAPDGVIEAVSAAADSRGSWVLGVQWHPERMPDDELQRRLARWFVARCDG